MSGRPGQILVVDDDAPTRRLLQVLLEEEGHAVRLAASAPEARHLIQQRSFDVILCDVQLPGEPRLSFASHVAAEYPGTATIMLTGLDNSEVAETTVAFGAFGYLLKPVRATELLASVDGALRRLELTAAAGRERDWLHHELDEHTAELREAMQRLEDETRERVSCDTDTMRQMARAIEYRSRETGDHIDRVAAYSALIARRCGLGHDEVERIRTASVMHDVGKVAIADEILLKPGPLTVAEREEMERHAEIGYDVLRATDGELMRLAAAIAWSHHEHFDGAGYPRGLAGDQIPHAARIVAVADVFDALTHDRVYRPALPLDEALATMAEGRGTHFDPEALGLLFESLDDALAIGAPGGVARNGA